MSNPSLEPTQKNYKTGVSLQPEVVRCLDDIASQTGLSRSWVLNTIVLAYFQLREEKNLPPISGREKMIRL